MKKLSSLFLVLLACTALNAQSNAYCGNNLLWFLDSRTKALTITGYGDMYEFESPNEVPWYPYNTYIDSVSFVYSAVVPDDPYKNIPYVPATEGAVTLVWHIANIDEMCEEVGYVFAGNYNYWSTDPATMAHFEPIEGFHGWYKAVVVLQEGVGYLEGKPCALAKDGTFPSAWDYQWIGTVDHPCELVSGAAIINIEYEVESRLICSPDADVVYIRSYAFKENPCVDPVYENVTFNLTTTVPVAAGGTVYIVGDAFAQSWDPTAYPMTGSGTNWTVTLPAIVGREYKFCVNGDWTNEQMKYDNEKACAESQQQNFRIDFVTMTPTVYGFRNFGITEEQVCHEEYPEGVMYIKCAGNGWEWAPMTVDPNNNLVFTYETTVLNADVIGANISISESSDGQWYPIDDAGFNLGDAIRYIFTSTNGDNGNLVVAYANNAPVRKQRMDSDTPTPAGITSISRYAFEGCSSLTSIEIPATVASIGDCAFQNCTALASVTLPNSVTSIGGYVFYGCTSLTTPVYNAHVFAYMPTSYAGAYTIPNGIESIAATAFYGCTGLTSIEAPNSVTSIGYRVFQNCRSLTSVTIPNSAASADDWIYGGCINLTSVVVPANTFNIEEGDWSRLTHSLQSVTFTSGELTYNVLGVLARSYKTLTSLDVSGVSNTELADEAFKNFYNLQSLVLPANLTKIGYMSVAECVSLLSIDIPASVTEIAARAFENCRSLNTITFGGQASAVPGRNATATSASQLQTIGNWAFYNCHELQNLTIPEGVTSIGDGAFYGCTYLEELALPASIQSIGDNTFALCAKLKMIVVNAPVPPSIQTKTFFDVNRQIPVYVPDASVNAYQDDAYWQEFDIQGISNMPQGIDQIESSSLQGGDRGRLILHNGQVLILRGEKTYTVTGQEVR